MKSISCFGQQLRHDPLSGLYYSTRTEWPLLEPVGQDSYTVALQGPSLEPVGQDSYRVSLPLGGNHEYIQGRQAEEVLAAYLYLHGGTAELTSLRACLVDHPDSLVGSVLYWQVGTIRIPRSPERFSGSTLIWPILGYAEDDGRVTCVGHTASCLVDGSAPTVELALLDYWGQCRAAWVSRRARANRLVLQELEQSRLAAHQVDRLDRLLERAG